MRQYVVTDEEMQSLIDQLELKKLREDNITRGDEKTTLDDMHRSFHYVVVRWTQAMGYKGHR